MLATQTSVEGIDFGKLNYKKTLQLIGYLSQLPARYLNYITYAYYFNSLCISLSSKDSENLHGIGCTTQFEKSKHCPLSKGLALRANNPWRQISKYSILNPLPITAQFHSLSLIMQRDSYFELHSQFNYSLSLYLKLEYSQTSVNFTL